MPNLKKTFYFLLALLLLEGPILFATSEKPSSMQSLVAKKQKEFEASLASFREAPYEQAYEHIKNKGQKSKAAPLFNKIPKFYTLATNFLRDEEAPIKFFGILKDKRRLVSFTLITFSLMIIGHFLKKRRKKKQLNLGESFMASFGQFFFFTGLKLVLFFYFFRSEIMPTWRVIKMSYF